MAEACQLVTGDNNHMAGRDIHMYAESSNQSNSWPYHRTLDHIAHELQVVSVLSNAACMSLAFVPWYVGSEPEAVKTPAITALQEANMLCSRFMIFMRVYGPRMPSDLREAYTALMAHNRAMTHSAQSLICAERNSDPGLANVYLKMYAEANGQCAISTGPAIVAAEQAMKAVVHND